MEKRGPRLSLCYKKIVLSTGRVDLRRGGLALAVW